MRITAHLKHSTGIRFNHRILKNMPQFRSLLEKASYSILVAAVSIAFTSVPPIYAHQGMHSGDTRILPLGAKLKKLFDGAFFTEGAAVAPDGAVYFSDITFTYQTDMQAGHIWKYDPSSGKYHYFPFAQRHVQRNKV